MEQTIDLSDLIKIIKKNLWLILVLPLLFLIVGLVFSFVLITPKYEATTQLLVNQKEAQDSLMTQDIQSNLKLLNTYSEIIKSPRILDEVSNRIDNEYTSNEIRDMLTVSNQAESQVLNVSITSPNPNVSNILANVVAEVFSEDIKNIMNVDNVSILSVAEGKAKQVEPRTLVNAAIGGFIGLIIALILIFLKEVLDKRIRTEEQVAEILDLPVLGSIGKAK